MKVFLDANIIISVLNKEYPLFTFSSRILSLGIKSRFDLYTSPLCLAIAFYFASKKSGELQARDKIKIVLEHVKLTTIDDSIARQVVNDVRIIDFEDGLEYYSAVEKSCQVIITEDIKDFFFSKIEVLTCEEFILKYCRK
jgi:predicted nucleic acid-binding protein